MQRLIIVSLAFFLLGFTCERAQVTPTPSPVVSADTLERSIDTEAFIAKVVNGTTWELTLNPKHFDSAVASLAIHYNNIYYGVFLLTDTVYLPLLMFPEVELIISGVDVEGKPLTTETFFLRREPDEASKAP